MIPKIIWQTYKSKLPPTQSLKSIQSWIKLNPEFQWFYFDDEKCNQFIKDHFDTKFYSMYESLPFGVMKADVWRVAIVYIYGGLYVDLDTACLKTANEWIDDGNLIVMTETKHGSLANFAFAATPKHPALYTVLNTFYETYNSPNYLNKLEKCSTPIQNFGAHAFSYGILKHYGLSDEESMQKGGLHYNTIPKVIEDKTKFYTYEENRFAPIPNHLTYIHHQTASVFWNNGYDSWRKQQLKVFGV